MNPCIALRIERILIVGLGSIGKRHLRIARGIFPDADIRVLRHQLTNEIPEYSNGCFFCMNEVLEFKPQLAVITSPATFHIATAQMLAEAGVHLLIEKPLSASVEGVEDLIKTCRLKNAALLTGYNLRFLPSLQHFRHLLDEGLVGKVLSMRCEVGQYLPSWRPESDYRQSVSARHDLGGGALLELSHELDYLRWIFGEIKWIKATLSRQSSLEIDVEDTVHLILGFANATDDHEIVGTVNMDFIRHDTTRMCVAIGENGSLRWNGLLGLVELFESGSQGWRELINLPHQRDESYLAEWENFIQCAVGNKAPMVTGEDGLRVMQIIEAVRISAESGMQVSISN